MEYRPPLHFGVVAIEKGAFGSPSTTVANFTYMILRICVIVIDNIKYFYLIQIIQIPFYGFKYLFLFNHYLFAYQFSSIHIQW